MNGNGLSKNTNTGSYTASAPPTSELMRPPAENAKPQHRAIAVSPGNQPWCETVVITPELAEFWLKANTRNRIIRKSRVKSYARDMAAGRWLFSTQGITFGTDGSLLDGQHRLHAVIEAGVPITMVVWFNVPPTARSVIDIGASRSLADIAELTKRQAAVTQAMIRGMGGTKASVLTMAERSAFFRRFQPQIDGTIARFVTTHSGVTQATVLGTVARASLHIAEQDIASFCDVLQSGLANQGRDATVIRLRDRLLQGFSSAGGTQVIREMYALTAAAIRAYAANRSLSKLVPVSSDPFPLPGDAE